MKRCVRWNEQGSVMCWGENNGRRATKRYAVFTNHWAHRSFNYWIVFFFVFFNVCLHRPTPWPPHQRWLDQHVGSFAHAMHFSLIIEDAPSRSCGSSPVEQVATRQDGHAGGRHAEGEPACTSGLWGCACNTCFPLLFNSSLPGPQKVFFKKGGRSARAGEWSLWCCGDTVFLGWLYSSEVGGL